MQVGGTIMVKICVIAIVSLFFALFLSKSQKEYGVVLILSAVLVIAFFAVSQLRGILALLK